MAQPATADVLERCAADLHGVAFDFREERRSTAVSEDLIDQVERICATARAAVRGRG
jgi:hypothetical protein